MKKILLFLSAFILTCCFTGSAFAEIHINEYMSYEFLETQGYSQDMVRLVEINKAKTFGEPLPEQWSSNIIKRTWQKTWAYLDPSDDVGDFGFHDIKVRSTLWDY